MLENYPAENEFLSAIVHGITKIFPENITSIYLTGSLATGDYDPKLSDIDLLVVLNAHWTDEQLEALKEWARKIIISEPLAQHLDIAFGEQEKIVNIDGIKQFPAIEFWKGEISISETTLAYNAIVWNTILQTGITLYGVNPNSLIKTIPPSAISHTIHSEFKTLHKLMNEVFDTDIKFRYYVITTCCRMLYTLETNKYISKKGAMQWYKGKNTSYDRLISSAEAYANGNENLLKQTQKAEYISLLNEVEKMMYS